MVRNFFPQSIEVNLATNTNHPPQSNEEVAHAPGTGLMEYQDNGPFGGDLMEYEASGAFGGENMEYEGV